LIARLEKKVVVNCEEANKGEEERGGGEEMPHVVVVKEIHPVAWLVQVPQQKIINKNKKNSNFFNFSLDFKFFGKMLSVR
jgi:hypothetical protein